MLLGSWVLYPSRPRVGERFLLAGVGCWCGVWESYSGREHLCMPVLSMIVVVVAGFSGCCGWVVVCGSRRLRPSGAGAGVCFLFCRCLRAFGGCLGMKGRRRTLQPAICLGELASEC